MSPAGYGVMVGVTVGEFVSTGVGVNVHVAIITGVEVRVVVKVFVLAGEAVNVTVAENVGVDVRVIVNVGVIVGVGLEQSPNFWTLLLFWSDTYIFPLLSTATPSGVSSCPSPLP